MSFNLEDYAFPELKPGDQDWRWCHKYSYLRKKLQAKGTKSAKRRLKAIGQRENRWISNINHCLSKTLVDHYESNTLYVIENLQDVTFERRYSVKSSTHDLHSWSFFDLANKLTYKAHNQGAEVLTVSASYTSQRCSKCGQIRKENRNHYLHQYHCSHCGFTTNDDRVAAMNLYELGKQYISGIEQPKFELTKDLMRTQPPETRHQCRSLGLRMQTLPDRKQCTHCHSVAQSSPLQTIS